jgi:hypothetical protein
MYMLQVGASLFAWKAALASPAAATSVRSMDLSAFVLENTDPRRGVKVRWREEGWVTFWGGGGGGGVP